MNYSYIHQWVRKTFGRASKCEECGLNRLIADRKRTFAWANLSGEYKQERADWKMMCYSCHKKYDLKRLNYSPWNKGNKLLREKICLECGKRYRATKKRQILCSQSCVSKRGYRSMKSGLYLAKEGLLTK